MSTVSGAASIAAHGYGLLLFLHILEEGDGSMKLPAVDGLGSLSSVLERHSEVGAAGAGRLRRGNLLGCVADLGGRNRLNQLSIVFRLGHRSSWLEHCCDEFRLAGVLGEMLLGQGSSRLSFEDLVS